MNIKKTINQFRIALRLTGITLNDKDITINNLGCPHSPSGLPKETMAIYIFRRNGQYLKIGKAGASSNARFRSQHYNPSRAKSNLAKSLLDDPDLRSCGLKKNNIEGWIKQNIERIDILVAKDAGIFVLNFLEAFLHCVCQPKYEGFEKQRKPSLFNPKATRPS